MEKLSLEIEWFARKFNVMICRGNQHCNVFQSDYESDALEFVWQLSKILPDVHFSGDFVNISIHPLDERFTNAGLAG